MPEKYDLEQTLREAESDERFEKGQYRPTSYKQDDIRELIRKKREAKEKAGATQS